MRRAFAVLAAVTAVAACPSAASAAAPSPPGANLPCTPTTAHPYPVVLVHGTFENRFDDRQTMSPALEAAGYVGEIERSARELRDFVAAVRAQTGPAKVSLLGHSQRAG